MTGCPDENTFLAFIDNTLPAAQAAELEAHIDGCPVCSELFVELGHLMLGQTQDDPTSSEHVLTDSPKTLGRFQLKQIVGAGGMGVVYEAFDPELGRRVAIKIIRPDKFDDLQDQRRARLKREARALASLSHPNVLTVYDVGEDDTRIWIAMEFIDGQPISDWVASARPTWREVMEVYIKAGQGLAAAHDHGLVHRDIKPDNILIGRDARVLLMDFGLASQHEWTTQSQVLSGSRDDPLTMTGVIVGTPMYMSPEQLAGQRLDAQADQFSFCVSLFEGIYGFRPFHGNTLNELSAAVNSGQLTKPRTRDIPDTLFDVLERGMSPRPAERFADMHTLLNALSETLNDKQNDAQNKASAIVVPEVSATPIDSATRDPRPSSNRALWIGAPLIIGAIVGAFALGQLNQDAAQAPPPPTKGPKETPTPVITANTEPSPKTQEHPPSLNVPISQAQDKIILAQRTSLDLSAKQTKAKARDVKASQQRSSKRPKSKRRSKVAALMTSASSKPPAKTANKGGTTTNVVPAPIQIKVKHGANFTEAMRQKVKRFHNTLSRSYIPACQGLGGYAPCAKAITRVRAEVGRLKAQEYLNKIEASGGNPNSVRILASTLQGFYVLAADQSAQAGQCKVAYEMQLSQVRVWARGGAPGSHKYKSARNTAVWKRHIEKKNPKCQGKL